MIRPYLRDLINDHKPTEELIMKKKIIIMKKIKKIKTIIIIIIQPRDQEILG